jgi:hypothetical protein
LVIDPGDGVISGTIASNADASSPYKVTVTAADTSANLTQTFDWFVSAARQIAISDAGKQHSVTGIRRPCR